jgi:flagellar hook assembly protein FlgD
VFALRADDGRLAHSDNVTVHAAIPTAVSGNSGLAEGLIRIEPNPARERTTFHFAVAREGTPVRMRIHDISGRFVATILDENFSSGSHRAQWNGRDGDGREAAAGVYFVVLEIGQRKDAGKLVFLR